MKDAIIDIRDAYVSYNGSAALDGVSLQVRAGESIVLRGPNGAGKTTLLTTINGFAALRSGCIRVFGLTPGGRALLEVRRRIGYVAQVQAFNPRMPITVRESVMTGVYGRLGWRRRVSRPVHDAVNATLDRLGLHALAARPLGHLSGGEQRRAMIARALVQEPEIILLDEPTASLDDQTRTDICSVIDELNRDRGLTVLWVTHDLDTMPASCTRVIRMQRGRIAADTPPQAAVPAGVRE